MAVRSEVTITRIAVVAVFSFMLGIAVYEVSTIVEDVASTEEQEPATSFSKLDDDFINREVNPSQIRDNLRYLTEGPHVAGTPEERATAQWVADQWTSQGLTDVHIVPYDVLLSYPDSSNPNRVRLVSAVDGSVQFESSFRQEPLYAPEEADDRILDNFNAYSAAATVQGDLVYANYALEEDFEELENLGVDVSGKVIIAKYGKNFRGDKVKSAQERGALGMVLFNDPADYAPEGYGVYPASVMMPPSAAQLGSVLAGKGDPQTPFYPSIESAFRYPEEECDLPSIPCQPISYSDAYVILNSLEGAEAPTAWQGGLNLTYHLGPALKGGQALQLAVHTASRAVTVHNVVASIPQTLGLDPDRYVLVGNHRDAWALGAVDPSSGTAAMLEVSRVLQAYRNETGWEPRRSIVFCSWAAEEFGLVGSSEWAEQFGSQLADRAVAYLNIDMAVNGNYTFRAQASPMLRDVIYNITKDVPNPDPAEVEAGRLTVYDTWLERLADLDDPSRPWIGNLASGSDYYSFQQVLGVSSLDIRYTDTRLGEPLYHTVYETFELVDELYDPGFLFHAATTAAWAKLTVAMATETVLPFSYKFYPEFIRSAVAELQELYGDLIASHNATLDHLTQAVDAFTADVAQFDADVLAADLTDPLAVRSINDRLLLLERAFLDPHGLPHRPQYLHVVTSPSEFDSYSGIALPGLFDALSRISVSTDAAEQASLWRDFDSHLGAVSHLVASAGAALRQRLW